MLNKLFKAQSFATVFLRGGVFFLFISFFWPMTTTAEKYHPSESIVKAEDAAREALAATLFYRFKEWASFFKNRISKLEMDLEKAKKDLENFQIK